jgi:hypothetical protein
VSAYAHDRRVQKNPDTWMVFSSDYTTGYCVREQCCAFDSFDAYGNLIPAASNRPTLDDAVRALIGDPR